MEARSSTALSDATPTGSQTQIITPDEIPDQVIEMSRLQWNELIIRQKSEVVKV